MSKPRLRAHIQFVVGLAWLCACVAVTLVLLACSHSDDANGTVSLPNLGLKSADIRIATRSDTQHLRVELAVNDTQRTMGLMERRSLDENAGMLFVYPTTQPNTAAFWMYRTRIPLDIAYIDSTGAIGNIVVMEPCTAVLAQGCPSYPARVAFRAALEVNKGYFARHQVATGDHVLLGDTSHVVDSTKAVRNH